MSIKRDRVVNERWTEVGPRRASPVLAAAPAIWLAASAETHHPYNYDWVWIVFVIAAVFLIVILVVVRFFTGRPHKGSPQPNRDQTPDPPPSDT